MNQPKPNALTAKLPEPIHSTGFNVIDGELYERRVWRTSYSLFSLRVEFYVSRNSTKTWAQVVSGNLRLKLTPGTMHTREDNVTSERVRELINIWLGYDVEVAD